MPPLLACLGPKGLAPVSIEVQNSVEFSTALCISGHFRVNMGFPIYQAPSIVSEIFQIRLDLYEL